MRSVRLIVILTKEFKLAAIYEEGLLAAETKSFLPAAYTCGKSFSLSPSLWVSRRRELALTL